MRFVDLFNAISSGTPAAPVLAAERHYLQFNGTSDYAVADAVFGGISGDYTIAIKVAQKVTSGSYYYAASDNTILVDMLYKSGSNVVFGGSLAPSYVLTSSGQPADSLPRVLAIKRQQSTGNATAVIADASGVDYTGADTSATYGTATRLAIGARVNPTAASFSNVQFIGLVIASAEIPDAELTDWLNGTDARDHITGIDHYWVASDIDGASIPARVGTVALALTGPTSSDLVAWSP